ncbi:MAG: hypothetical protein EOP45_08240 [Sphingobacteriaceae bacterium]|nr:MAG: hypothetical protein EOP45_08240 [Sphingobacteriaceae bacterium]
MKTELNERIEKWESEAVYNTRQVEIVKKLTTGEYILLLVEGAELNLEGEVKTVKVQKLFQTRSQSPSSTLNPEGDIYTFDLLSDIVARTYLDKASEAISQWIEENSGD